MADNVTLSTGDIMASDEVVIGSTTVQCQRVKLGYGVDGSYDGEASATTPLPVHNYIESSTMQNGTTQLTPKFVAVDAATNGDNTLIAAVTGKKIRVLAAVLVMTGTAVTARFEDGTGGTALTGQMQQSQGNSIVLPFNPVGWFETTAATLLNLELSGAQSVDGCIVYVEV